ncbi:MAG: hypothetical protein U5J83_00280 [Bryobacterales bacterium]|nr:hypothetical protein [Bryobacterales bacterium]
MKTIRIALAAAFVLAGTALFAAEKADLPKDAEIAKMAESARSASEHAAVAKAYRLRAEEFAETAERLEAEVAKKQTGPKVGMSSKWPAMSRNSAQREKQQAIAARRAARESQEMAALHTQLAVEAGFKGAVEAKRAVRSESADGSR